MSFFITGPWLTRHARDRVFEYGADDAVRFLLTSVEGLDAAQAAAILAGTKKIVGDSRAGIDVVADDDAADRTARDELAAQYRWHFAGVWFDRSAKVYLRPYAVVTGWGADDLLPQRIAGHTVENRYRPRPTQSMVARCAGGDPEGWGDYRCIKYANDPINDRVIGMFVPGHDGMGVACYERATLWRPVPAPPSWWRLPKTADEALAEYVGQRGQLEERGAHIEYARERRAREPAPESVAGAEPGPLSGNVFGADPPVLPGVTTAEEGYPAIGEKLLRELMSDDLPEHVKAGIVRVHTDASDPRPQRVTDPAAAPYAWVARDGAFWTCRGYMDHAATAPAIAESLGMDLARWKDNAEHALGEMGWAKVGRDAQGEPFAWLDAAKTPGDAQFDAVARWLVHHEADPLDIQAWADGAKRPE